MIKNMTYEELKQKFQDRTVGEGWFLLAASDTLEMIDMGLKHGLELDIVEGFLKSTQGAFEPRQEYSSNQFSHLDGNEYNVKTTELIEASAAVPDLYFEVLMH